MFHKFSKINRFSRTHPKKSAPIAPSLAELNSELCFAVVSHARRPSHLFARVPALHLNAIPASLPSQPSSTGSRDPPFAHRPRSPTGFTAQLFVSRFYAALTCHRAATLPRHLSRRRATAAMPPKKKKAEEQKKKIVEDKTFGLKNKKKSKKVQQYVETVKKQASQKVDGPRRKGGASGSGSAASAARMAQMQARLAELELMNQPVQDKPKKMSAAEAEQKRIEEEEEAERIRIANLPVEDQIEEERVKLKTKTPVTLDRFMQWREEKNKENQVKVEAERAAAYKKMSKAEKSRRQGLTGKELFEAHSGLFVDDENAVDERLKPISDYIGDDSEVQAEDKEGDGEEVMPGDTSLFGGEETPGAGPSSAPSEAVAVGDESLFS